MTEHAALGERYRFALSAGATRPKLPRRLAPQALPACCWSSTPTTPTIFPGVVELPLRSASTRSVSISTRRTGWPPCSAPKPRDAFAAWSSSKDTQGSLSLYALRGTQAGDDGRPDGRHPGFRNTFQNPWAEPDFLRPATDVVLAAGPDDAERRSPGATRRSPPACRLDACATARVSTTALGFKPVPRVPGGDDRHRQTPAFSDAGTSCSCACSARSATHSRLPRRRRPCWRLTDGLSERLGVQNDPRPLGECLNNFTPGVLLPRHRR